MNKIRLKKSKLTSGLLKATLISILVLTTFSTKQTNAALVLSTESLGNVENPSRTGLGRDGGLTVKLGNKILWMFGDTLFHPASVDGTHIRTNTAALADPSSPYSLTEPLDANGAPYQFIPFNPQQQAHNDAAVNKSRDRYIIWPDRAINIDANNAYIFYKNIKATPVEGSPTNAYTLSQVGIGVAQVGANSTTATRVLEHLFQGSEDNYSPEFIHNGYVYAYHCVNGFLVGNCAVARAPKQEILQRSSYRFWDGSQWQEDIEAATHHIIGSTSSMTVIYSHYLKKYLMLGAGGFAHEFYLKTADSPQGPWSSQEIFHNHGSQVYGGRMHPEIEGFNSQNLVFTHTSSTGMKVVKLTFDPSMQGPPDPEEPQQPSNPDQEPNAPEYINDPGSPPPPSPAPQQEQKPILSPKTGKIIGGITALSALFGIAFFLTKEHHFRKQQSKTEK